MIEEGEREKETGMTLYHVTVEEPVSKVDEAFNSVMARSHTEKRIQSVSVSFTTLVISHFTTEARNFVSEPHNSIHRIPVQSRPAG